jgi:hypothetical protein
MAYQFTTPRLGAQAIADTSATQKHHLGEIQQAVDPTYGNGEFIYLLGVTSTVVGSVVEYDSTFQSGLVTLAVNIPRPIAVAMSVNVGSQYGWYQISGVAVMIKDAAASFAAGAAVNATSGVAVEAVTALVIHNALAAASAHGTSTIPSVEVMINRPSGPGSSVD